MGDKSIAFAPLLLAQAGGDSRDHKAKKAALSSPPAATVHDVPATTASTVATAAGQTQGFLSSLSFEQVVFLGITALIVLAVIIKLLGRRSAKVPQPSGPPAPRPFVEPEYRIPHCDSERTATSFYVSYARGLIPQPNNIHVDGEGVTVNGDRYRRTSFGGLAVLRTESNTVTKGTARRSKTSTKEVAFIGFRYGGRTFELKGAWDPTEATEFCAAFNQVLRETPLDGDANVSPDVLREAARTDEF